MRLKVHIPGDHIVLTKPWTFKLYAEHRNSALHKWTPATGAIAGAVTWQDELYGGLGYYWDNPATGRREIRHIDVTLPAGAELQFDRVYIRKGAASGYNSVTFRWRNAYDAKGKPLKNMRFWAELEDVNKIEYEDIEL